MDHLEYPYICKMENATYSELYDWERERKKKVVVTTTVGTHTGIGPTKEDKRMHSRVVLLWTTPFDSGKTSPSPDVCVRLRRHHHS